MSSLSTCFPYFYIYVFYFSINFIYLICFVFTQLLSNNFTESSNISRKIKAIVNFFFIQMKIVLLNVTFFNHNSHSSLFFFPHLIWVNLLHVQYFNSGYIFVKKQLNETIKLNHKIHTIEHFAIYAVSLSHQL